MHHLCINILIECMKKQGSDNKRKCNSPILRTPEDKQQNVNVINIGPLQ